MKRIVIIQALFLFHLLFYGFGNLNAQPTNYDREWGTYGDGAIKHLASSEVDGSDNLFVSYVSEADPLYVKSTIDKFSPDGEFLLSIPFDANEASIYIDDMKIDQNGDLIVCGWTNSPDAFGTPGAWQEENAGSYDRFLAKLDSETGAVIWSTYFGGPANDEDGEDDNSWEYNSLIAISDTNEIVWTTNMHSEGMGTSGVFQEMRNGDRTGYVISLFGTSGQRIWTTYYGYDHSIISGLQVDVSGVYIAGRTGGTVGYSDPYFDTSNTWIVTPYQTDAYISKFDYTGNRLWSYYFGGVQGEDLLKNTLGQTANKLYLTGFTVSAEGITTEGTYLPSIDNFTSSGFLVEFDKDGIYQWGTYLGEKLDYGGSFPEIIADKDAKNIYVTGFTTTREGLATPGAFQETLNGDSDVFVMEFDDTGQRLFGTYYGGENDEDVLFAVLASFSEGFYLAGMTNSLTGISTPGAFQETYAGDSSPWADALFIARFEEAPLAVADIGRCGSGIKLYPNPAKESINLQFDDCTVAQDYKGVIFNYLGQQIFTFKAKTADHFDLDINELPSGLYHIQIELKNHILSETFIKE